ncbi:MAG: hypothetical protein ACI9K2_002045 [Myxococcota bacterium]|jgi:hypothetical protein
MRPHEAVQNMRIGFQIGQHTDYLLGGWDTEVTGWDAYGNAMMAGYVVINRPDGTFHGEDWTTARSGRPTRTSSPSSARTTCSCRASTSRTTSPSGPTCL